jgi:hypothetical protein
MTLPTHLSTQFWQEGYLVLDGFFDSELMDQLNQSILDHFGETPEYFHTSEFLAKSGVEVVPWFPQQVGRDEFNLAANNDRLIEITTALLGEEWQELYCMVMFSRQGSRGQSWHQDCPPEDSTQFNLNRLVYTHDITPEIGGQTVVVPGSHRRGVIPVGDPDASMEGQVVLQPKKGTLVLLHGHTWHRVLPVSGRYRVSTNYRSCPKGVPQNVTDVCVYRNMRYRFSTGEFVEDRVGTPA